MRHLGLTALPECVVDPGRRRRAPVGQALAEEVAHDEERPGAHDLDPVPDPLAEIRHHVGVLQRGTRSSADRTARYGRASMVPVPREPSTVTMAPSGTFWMAPSGSGDARDAEARG